MNNLPSPTSRQVSMVATLGALALCVSPLGGAVASQLTVDEKVRNALQLDQNAKRGGQLYAQNCARCHGGQALGSAAKVIPALAGQRRAYLVKQLADFSEEERQGPEMHQVVNLPDMDEPQTWADIAGYLNSLPGAHFPQTGDDRGIELGAAIFREQCASCHEEDARGDDDGFVPSLRDQHYSYLVRQVGSIAAWHRFNVDADFVRFLGGLDTEETTAVADYLSRLRGPVRDRSRLNSDGTVNE